MIQPTPLIVVAFVLLFAGEASSQAIPLGSGLEVENHQTVEVVVEDLRTAAGDIGLTVDRLRTKIELRLRQAGLRPGERSSGEVLYVNVNVVGRGFSVLIEFRREVYYVDPAGTIRRVSAATWRTGVAGTHGRNSEYIIQAVDRELDQFLNEYLKANGQ